MALSQQYEIAPPLIILVEDDDGDAQAVQRAFRKAKWGDSVVRVVDGIAALELLRSPAGKATLSDRRLLLVDLNMPRMN